MPDYIVDKVLTVINVATITELATGDLINQVNFGNYIENTPEVLNRFPTPRERKLYRQTNWS